MRGLLREICLTFFVLSTSLVVYGQSSTNYSIVNSTTGSLNSDMNGNPISFSSAPNLIQNSISSSVTALQSIGFDFYFMGRYYSHFVCTDDGAMGLGISTSPSSILFTSIANDLTRPVAFPYTSNTSPVLAPFWDNIRMPDTGPTIRKITVGTAPNRCTVVEFNVNINNNSMATTSTGQFQVRLYESTGVIEYVYGNMTIGTNSSVVTASIGFTAGTTDNSFLALKDLTSFAFAAIASQEPATENLVNTNTPGPITGLHSTSEGSRRLFRFIPPALIGGPLTGLQTSGVGASCMTVGWQDSYTNEAGYSVFRSTDNVNFTLVASLPPNTTRYTDYGLSYGITYYWKVVAASEGVGGNAVTTSATTACGMSGVYSVGGGGHFPTLGNALDSLRIRGIAGNTVFELLAGYDLGPENLPITFPKNADLPCFSADRRVTIRPAAGANLALYKMINVPIFLLDSCDYVTIDGRVNSSGTASNLALYAWLNTPAIQLINASHNKICYVTMQGGDDLTGTITHGVINMSGTKAGGCDENVIEGCSFSSYDLFAAKQVMVYSSTIGGLSNDRDTVRNCNFYDFAKHALYAGYGTNAWNVWGNSFYNSSPAVNYASSVAAIKIDYADNTEDNVIAHNYFGGTAPNAGGSPMLIDYKSRFHFIEAVGKGEIRNNVFKRIKFSNTIPAIQPATGFINTVESVRQFFGYISDNEFGGPNEADSINITYNGTSYSFFYGLNGGGFITGNRFSNIRGYTVSPYGTLHLNMIGISKAGYVKNNVVGDPAVANSIINYSDAPTIGINVYGPYSKVTDNQICHLTAGSKGLFGSALGIYVNSNGTDSIARNEIFQLSGYGGTGSNAALAGIFASSLTTGPNIAYQNHIHSLHYLGSSTAPVIGIVGGSLTVSANRIHSFSSSGAISNNIGIAGGNMIDNNMIQFGLDSLGNDITLPLRFIGITGGGMVTHNSVVITGSNVAPGNGVSGVTACIQGSGGPNPNPIKNNIVYNDRTAVTPGTLKNFCLDIGPSATTIEFSDFNVFYHPGPDNYIAPLNTTGFSTLASWQAASQLDLHSIEGDPLFVRPKGSASVWDLHISTGSVAEGKGTSQFTTVLDADRQVRSLLSPVDIGADAGNYAGTNSGCSAVHVRIDTVVCASQIPFNWRDTTKIDRAGDFSYSTLSSKGCDSTVTLHVTVSNEVSVLRDTVVCSNAVPFTWNSITVDKAGNFMFKTKSVGGCDSTITLNVSVASTVSSTKDTAVCANAFPFQWNGLNVTTAGNYPFTTKSKAGCDSTVTLHVSVINMGTVANDTTICAGSPIHLGGQAVQGFNYSWTSDNGFTAAVADPVVSPAITTFYYLQVTGACTYKDSVRVTVRPLLSPSVHISASASAICAGNPVIFTASPVNAGTSPSYAWKQNGSSVGSNSAVFTSSSLVDKDKVWVVMTSNESCVTTAMVNSDTSIVTVQSLILPQVSISGNTVVKTGDTTIITAMASGGVISPNYQWQDSTQEHGWQNITSATNSSLQYVPKHSGDKVKVVLTSNAACTSPNIVESNPLVFTVTVVTGVSSPTTQLVRVFPNPAHSVLVINQLQAYDQWQSAEILSMEGVSVINPINLHSQISVSIPIQSISSGTYMLMLKNRKGLVIYFKFIKL
jgi:hypothetical protein